MTFLNLVWPESVKSGAAVAGWVGALLILASLPLSRLGRLLPVSPQESTLRHVSLIGFAIGWLGILLCTVAVFTAETFRPFVLPLMVAGLTAGSMLIDLVVGRITRA